MSTINKNEVFIKTVLYMSQLLYMNMFCPLELELVSGLLHLGSKMDGWIIGEMY